MSLLHELLAETAQVADQRPWPRALVSPDLWTRARQHLCDQRLVLLGLWGDGAAVHMALLEEAPFGIAVLTVAAPNGTFPSIGAAHPPAIRLERTICDLHGLTPIDAPDRRPWLDHGRWGVQQPCAAAPQAAAPMPPYLFLPVEGESLHQIPVGPVHAGIIEPGHFRFTASGETVVRLEQRLGYVHKGIDRLMAGADLDRATRIAGRVSGDSTVAYAIAFAHAAESALNVQVPPRAVWLRALMAELERLANHFGDFGAVCNDAAFSMMHTQCGALRETTLRAAAAGFGHRLMMDRVVPGGVACDLDADGAKQIRRLLADAGRLFPDLVELYDNTASLQDRTVATGILAPALARQFGAGGHVGRASGRPFDARRAVAYAPYDRLQFDVPVLEEGDVNARVWIRIREIEQSLSLAGQILAQAPAGPTRVPVDPASGGAREGLGLVESFRGDVLAWVRFAPDGTIASCHLRDPSWFQWPLLEAAIENNIVADFPLCNKSFNCSYSGHDL